LRISSEYHQPNTDKKVCDGLYHDPIHDPNPLDVLLLVAVLVRLAGESRLEPMADWARLRAADLAGLLGLPRAKMPQQCTWSRVFGHAVDAEIARVGGQLAAGPADATSAASDLRASPLAAMMQ
jgi:hypothetical protein